VLALAAVLVVVLTALVAPARAVDPPRATGWYLALGDSLAAGYQLDGAEPEAGYVRHVLAGVREVEPKTKLVNLGCGGESTDSMIAGGICDYDEGSQLAQAEEFLHAHAKRTRLVTLTIGGNNVQRCVSRPTGQIDLACVQAGLARAQQDLQVIMARLRAVAPGVELVVTNYYNPFLVLWFAGPAGQALAQQSSALQMTLNSIIGGAATAHDADVADVATGFHSYTWTPAPGTTIPLNVATICRLTLMCAHMDIHANDAGYQVIGEAIVDEVG
jgi:lysophospholipase L1-like esterase